MSRNQLHAAARAFTAAALKAGKITRQPCEACGSDDAEAHHVDYMQPLDLRWLCRTHHQEHHKQNGFAGRNPGRPPRAGVASLERVEIRVTKAEKRTWERNAKAEGMSLSDWLRGCANAAIGDA